MAKKKKPIIDEEIIIISKSEQKRDAKEIQEMAQTIARYNNNQRNLLPLNEEIHQALKLADKIRGKHDAYARNIRFISKQLAELDLEELKFAIHKIENRHAFELIKSEKLEALRAKLIAGDQDKLEQLLAENPKLERQRLRQLTRQAAKEMAQEKPGKSVKELFKYLKESVEIED
ncbi:ribosome biogenesis factor YjgA [Thalassotalea aquiviva]|uniref:ribosome biogenesis factor YjgA n=1 Tax=Thalassotalea aquiviva TaxID=3242415 RepID=UPI00352A3314